jgi:hypothetical protein
MGDRSRKSGVEGGRKTWLKNRAGKELRTIGLASGFAAIVFQLSINRGPIVPYFISKNRHPRARGDPISAAWCLAHGFPPAQKCRIIGFCRLHQPCLNRASIALPADPLWRLFEMAQSRHGGILSFQ